MESMESLEQMRKRNNGVTNESSSNKQKQGAQPIDHQAFLNKLREQIIRIYPSNSNKTKDTSVLQSKPTLSILNVSPPNVYNYSYLPSPCI